MTVSLIAVGVGADCMTAGIEDKVSIINNQS